MPAITAEQAEFFEKEIRPVLVNKCVECHGPETQESDVRLDGLAHMLKGNVQGPLLVPGDPDGSRLIKAIRHSDKVQMPPDEKLPDTAIAALTTWVQMGAPWPGDSNVPAFDTKAEAAKAHWAFQRVRKPEPPAVQNAGRVQTPVDQFILARLEQQGIAPAAPADRRVLIRRLTFDLIGIPPTPEEVEAFVSDTAPDAVAKVVDRLLGSPHYGERWGRYWLDLARYADTKGYVFEEDRRYQYAYKYRDWVVKAFNSDLPYDQFLIRQLAADRLVAQGADKNELAAMGFLTVGRRFLNNQNDIIDDRIDVVTRGMMGLTVTCARCHDHKYDPIPTKDYYSLYGVFSASVEKTIPLGEASEEYQKELALREKAVADYVQAKQAELANSVREKLPQYLQAAYERRNQPITRDRDSDAADVPELNPVMLQRWRRYIDSTSKKHHPVFAPWHALAALPEADFSAKAAELSPKLAAPSDPNQPINPLVAKLFEGTPPSSFLEVTRRYAKLLSEVDAGWQALLAEAEKNKAATPTALPDPAQEELRQVLFADGSPLNFSGDDSRRIFNPADRRKIRELRNKVTEWMNSDKAPSQAMVLEDKPDKQGDPFVLLRGNPNNQGPQVPRQFLEVLAGESRKPFTDGSGREELARAIASPENPLTARVWVNRVWTHFFGAGVVTTPSDFGLRSTAPSHPELLDYLAARFVEEGWSTKKLHRLILLSSTYQQSSSANPEAIAKDPENRLFWRMNRRRLDFEATRDALLAVASSLDRSLGGPAVDLMAKPFTTRRSIYGSIDRQNLPGMFRTFDFASPDTHSPQRYHTTVPQQALFLMNNPFAIEQARRFSERADVLAHADAAERIARMYTLAFARQPLPEETSLGLRFIEAAPQTETEKLSPWARYAQTLLLTNEFMFLD